MLPIIFLCLVGNSFNCSGDGDHNKTSGTVWHIGYGNAPVEIPGLSDIVSVTCGFSHSAALKRDGTVWTWGANGNGQLGDGTTVSRDTPFQVVGLNSISLISTGWSHTVALKSDGTVWSWGANNLGQLGDGTTINRYVPTQVSALEDVVAVSTGGDFTLALKSDGTVWSWGFESINSEGYFIFYTTPQQVSGITDVIAIAAGEWIVSVFPVPPSVRKLALKSDRTVWEWGWWGWDSDSNVMQIPTKIEGLDNVIDIATGGAHSLALKSDGEVWSWGLNENGQLGDGTTEYKDFPVKVTGLSNVVNIEASMFNSGALKSDKTLWIWGGTAPYYKGAPQEHVLIPTEKVSNITSFSLGRFSALVIKD